MRHSSLASRSVRRRGVAILMALVAMALLVVVMGVVTGQILTSRRQLAHRAQQLQAQALAHAGLELAAARVLANPAAYDEETEEIVPRSHIRIKVLNTARADVFRVTCGVMYPTDEPYPVVQIRARKFRRIVDGNRVRLEVVPETDE
jgi:hypothetical protein